MDHDNTSRLVRDILKGRKELFAELVTEFGGPVYNLALRMTGSSSEAAELTQEVFIRAWLSAYP
jgi:DNA-directed RNA polymerase specialized sigma24 family protein